MAGVKKNQTTDDIRVASKLVHGNEVANRGVWTVGYLQRFLFYILTEGSRFYSLRMRA